MVSNREEARRIGKGRMEGSGVKRGRETREERGRWRKERGEEREGDWRGDGD